MNTLSNSFSCLKSTALITWNIILLSVWSLCVLYNGSTCWYRWSRCCRISVGHSKGLQTLGNWWTVLINTYLYGTCWDYWKAEKFAVWTLLCTAYVPHLLARISCFVKKVRSSEQQQPFQVYMHLQKCLCGICKESYIRTFHKIHYTLNTLSFKDIQKLKHHWHSMIPCFFLATELVFDIIRAWELGQPAI